MGETSVEIEYAQGWLTLDNAPLGAEEDDDPTQPVLLGTPEVAILERIEPLRRKPIWN
jgi:hypothetical protein